MSKCSSSRSKLKGGVRIGLPLSPRQKLTIVQLFEVYEKKLPIVLIFIACYWFQGKNAILEFACVKRIMQKKINAKVIWEVKKPDCI